MIIALLALAVAMILGGLLAAFFGWDIVLVERGWTMVIAGSVTAASGALLLGIAAAVSKLSKIERRLLQLRDGFGEAASTEAPGSSKGLSLAALSGGIVAGKAVADAGEDAREDERPDEAQPTLPLFEGEDRRERDEDLVKAAEWPEEKRADEPVISFPPRTSPAPASSREDEETDMKVPDFLLADRGRDTDEEEPRVLHGADPYHRDLDEPEPEPRDLDEPDRREEPAEAAADREPGGEREAAVEAEGDRQPEAEEEETDSDESRPATIVGTYNSGENRYVMFSNGSIEAHTPSGVFRFQSLDELKEFIAAGGEGSSSSSI